MSTLQAFRGTAHVVEVIGLFKTENQQTEIAESRESAQWFAVYVRRSCADEITAEHVLSLDEFAAAREVAELIASQLNGTLADAVTRCSDLVRLIKLSTKASIST